VSNYAYVESPMIESVLGLPTLQEIDFWYNLDAWGTIT
jgi:hypothetical protein